MAGSVFHDPSGRRGRRAGLALGLVLATIAAIGAGFATTLALAPKMPNLQLKDPLPRSALHVETPTHGKLRRNRCTGPRFGAAPARRSAECRSSPASVFRTRAR